MPDAWQQEFQRGQIVAAAGESILPFAVSPTSDSVFASDYSQQWYGITMISPATRAHQRIANLPPTDQVLTGTFDGRWLVWTQLHSLTTYFDWTMYSWDSQSGQVSQLAAATFVNGQPITGPVAWPAVRDGMVGWSQAISSDTSQLHLRSLSGGTDKIVATGPVSDPVFVGALLIWYQTDSTGQHSHFAAATAAGAPATVPAPLSGVMDPTMLAASSDALAWSTAGLQQLYVWRASWPLPIRIVTVTRGDYAEYPHVVGDVITYDGANAAYAADLRSSSLTQMTPQAGAILGQGQTIALNYLAPNTAKALHPPQRVFVLRAAQLPALPKSRGSCN